MQKDRDESTSEQTRLKAKIAEYESRGADTTALSKQLAQEQKEKAELISQIRALKREASPEFKDKWDKPFDNSIAFAKQFTEQLAVLNEDMEPIRQASWDDFLGLYRLPYNKMISEAKKMFGDASAGVVQHITDLQKMEYQRGVALKSEQEQWQKNEEEERTRTAQQRDFVETNWIKVNKEIAERHPEFYMDDPKDPDGNKLLKEGFDLVDSRPATIQEKIIHDAHVRLKAASQPRLIYKMRRLQEELEDANSKIAELQGSKPGKVQKPASGDGAATPKDRTGMAGLKDDLRDALAS